MSTRILIVDDHQMMCDGLHLLLARYPGAEVVGSCGDSATAFRMSGELRPDLVLMDVDLPDGSGIALTRRLREAYPEVKVLVLTGRLEPNLITEATAAGASGYLVKTNAATELLDAIRKVLAGGLHFSGAPSTSQERSAPPATLKDGIIRVRQTLPARESQVLALLVNGMRNKEIAAKLNLNVKTVETYRGRLMKRFGCASPAELVRYAIRVGLAIP